LGSSKRSSITLIYPAILVVLGTIWLLWHSRSSTPLLDGFYGYDAAAFRVVGKAWSEGLIPYRDVFDHKGPIFLLFYMLGYSISDSKWSIFIIQCILFSVTVVSLYKIACLFAGEKLSFIFSCMTLLAMAKCIDEGALTEEFSLPFLCVSLYFQLRWFKNCREAQGAGEKTCRHPWQWAFLYGICFMCIALIRLNNAFALCFFVLVITIRLAVNREYRNLLQNAGGFLLGMFLVFLPVSIYFLINHVFYDMIYSVFLFNLKYMGATAQRYSLFLWVYALYLLLPLLILFTVSILYCLRRDRWLGIACALCCVFSFRLLTSGSIFPHYYVICIPYLPIALGMLKEIVPEKVFFPDRLFRWGVWMAIAVLCAASVHYSSIRVSWVATEIFNNPIDEFNEASRKISAQIPLSERDRVIGYNLSNGDAAWYLTTGIMPCYRIFCLNEWFAKIDPAIREENASFLKSGKVKWVVTMRGEFEDETIKAIMADNYYLYKTEHLDITGRDMDLYRLKYDE